MSKSLKAVFEQVQAESSLKENTKAYIAQHLQSMEAQKHNKMRYMKYAIACACMIFMTVTIHRVYFTATVQISIDINPSIELSVNRFNQVVGIQSFNDDGSDIVNRLDIRWQDYHDALRIIKENEKIAALLSDDEIMTITVTGSDFVQSKKVLKEIETDTENQKNTYCYHADDSDVQHAHEIGLSFGKYRAYLELKKLLPDIDEAFIADKTMREIHDLIHEHSQSDNDACENTSDHHHGHNGNNKGNGNKNGYRNHNGS